jgi:hypothetical protein
MLASRREGNRGPCLLHGHIDGVALKDQIPEAQATGQGEVVVPLTEIGDDIPFLLLLGQRGDESLRLSASSMTTALPTRQGEHEDVASGAAGIGVGSVPTEENVIAEAPVHQIRSTTPDQQVLAVLAEQVVAALAPAKLVVAFAAVEKVATLATIEEVAAFVTVEPVFPLTALECVIPIEADEIVQARTSFEKIGLFGAQQSFGLLVFSLIGVIAAAGLLLKSQQLWRRAQEFFQFRELSGCEFRHYDYP